MLRDHENYLERVEVSVNSLSCSVDWFLSSGPGIPRPLINEMRRHVNSMVVKIGLARGLESSRERRGFFRQSLTLAKAIGRIVDKMTHRPGRSHSILQEVRRYLVDIMVAFRLLLGKASTAGPFTMPSGGDLDNEAEADRALLRPWLPSHSVQVQI